MLFIQMDWGERLEKIIHVEKRERERDVEGWNV